MYLGNDLGASYFEEYTIFKVWSPTASRLKVVLYNDHLDELGLEYDMSLTQEGVWELKLYGDWKNKYYKLRVTIGNSERETADPYAKAASVNGSKGMIVDFSSIEPDGWKEHPAPRPIKPTEAIIYEMHVRDFSIDINSGMAYKGKFLAFSEEGVRGAGDAATGIEHLKELGVTHIHFMPIFDFSSVDERNEAGYNWGYDPYLYFVPEGSYSTNPYDGRVRIEELKRMIKVLHENNIGVVMDVVFNHTSGTEDSPFNILTPQYFYRMNYDGTYSNGSGCGNEIASERSMVRKFIIDCLKFWVEEYNIDGFRFDLMALMDIETMAEVRKQLWEVNPNILIYGEPWTGGSSMLDYSMQFKKGSQRGTGIGIFNDEFRNAIKGDNDGWGKGFINGGQGLEHEIRKGITGSIHYNDFIWGFAEQPGESVNYVSSHDNLTLYDKIVKTCPESSEEEREKMNRLALSIILTAQGVVFMQGGSELLRAKQGNHNSYNAGDEVNKIEWCNKVRFIETFEYIRGLISIRRSQKVMTLDNAQDIVNCLKFIDSPEKSVAFILHSPYKEDYKHILIIHNANRHEICMNTPWSGVWKLLANGRHADVNGILGGTAYIDSHFNVEPLATYILVQ